MILENPLCYGHYILYADLRKKLYTFNDCFQRLAFEMSRNKPGKKSGHSGNCKCLDTLESSVTDLKI